MDVYPLGLEREKIGWSDYLKYKTIEIEGNVITNTQTVDDCCFALLNLGFNRNVKRKQCWGVKIINSDTSIGVGICSKYLIEKTGFG